MATQLLVIEDDLQIQENVAELLTLKGYTVATASNGHEGVMQALLHRPDLILCDVMMPKMDGYQVLGMIRNNRALATVPFIFLTAKADLVDLRQGMVLGADDYLTKPFTSSDLLRAIDTRLEQEKRRALDMQSQLEKQWYQLGRLSAHEYNTALSGIVGFAQLLRDFHQSFAQAELQNMLSMILASSLRLKRTLDNSRLANDLMMPSATVAGGSALLSEKTVGCTLETIKPRYEEVIQTSLDILPAQLNINAENLAKILEELLDNALKFSLEPAHIGISGRHEDAGYALRISNQGRYFAPEHLAAIAPYTQFDREVFEQQGAGLGLYIVKRLTELYGGRLFIDDQGTGQTTVGVWLPLATEAASN